MNPKQNVLVFFIVTGLILGCAALLSYVEDPGGAFSRNIKERGIADILLSGHNVANVKNFDERLLQKDLIQNDSRQNEIIVLGSSRALLIRSSDFPGKTLFNHGVSGASIEDIIAILELYEEKGYLPDQVIFGVDPWIFNAHNEQTRWTTLKAEYQNGSARIGMKPQQSASGSVHTDITSIISRYSSLLSRPVVIDSVEQILFGSYYQTDVDDLEVDVILTDGSHSDPWSVRNQSAGRIDAAATLYAKSPANFIQNFDAIDGNLREQFESTVRYLKANNVSVIFYLSPYHPIAYQKFLTDPEYKTVRDVETYLREYAAAENITLIGSYDPAPFNLTSTDFTDPIHPGREAVKKILSPDEINRT
jgi:hypothetical protein